MRQVRSSESGRAAADRRYAVERAITLSKSRDGRWGSADASRHFSEAAHDDPEVERVETSK